MKIHPNDAPKLIRAIEVCMATRAPMSELWQQDAILCAASAFCALD